MAGKCDLPLHGLTVVLDTPGTRFYLGRYDFEDNAKIVLRDAEVRDVLPGEDKSGLLARSAKYGVFKTHDRIEVPRREISSVRRLAEISPEDPESSKEVPHSQDAGRAR
jgi:hypothetical protein